MVKRINSNFIFSSLMVLLIVSINPCNAEIANISVSRNITPDTISCGESFDVSVEIVIEGAGVIFGTLSEDYTASDNMLEWEISNIDADSVFVHYKNNGAGMYEWSAGMSTVPEGIYRINYRMTPAEGYELGTYQVSGKWVDTDYPERLEPLGSNEITLKVSDAIFSSDISESHSSSVGLDH
ncbi:hypothetical protein [Methanolobus profundi]|uniref:Uncharacterized protein n=1 Tax=Methanolobus profundi TaxID=487685 RepID=A0A1I4PFR9_9EURY|nr:hypothetical protein [Methanolobus profundi]SFM26520.1 hypothetical protein SAMN04488696_0626 [Methanolobus profundi]